MADIRQGSSNSDPIGPTGGSLGQRRETGPGEALQPEWIGQGSPKKQVACNDCGRVASVPVKWPDKWVCHTCLGM